MVTITVLAGEQRYWNLLTARLAISAITSACNQGGKTMILWHFEIPPLPVIPFPDEQPWWTLSNINGLQPVCINCSGGNRMTATAVVLRTLLVIASLTSPSPLGISFSRAAEVIASQDSYIDGVIAEITQCRRKEGVLTIEMKLHNTTTQEVSFFTVLDYDDFYVTAKNKKYSVLRDTEKNPIARQASGNITIKQGSSWTLWAKYPAPPPDVKNITYVTSLTVPFDDLPVTD